MEKGTAVRGAVEARRSKWIAKMNAAAFDFDLAPDSGLGTKQERDRALARAGMDYATQAQIVRHPDWSGFEQSAAEQHSRIVLFTSAGSQPLPDARFLPGDILLFGSESAGVPAAVHDRADYQVRIPMRPGFRSLNVAVSAGIALAEALRQTGQFPSEIDQ